MIVVVSGVRVDDWDGPKSWSSASEPAAFLPDLLLAGAGQCLGTGSQVVVVGFLVFCQACASVPDTMHRCT